VLIMISIGGYDGMSALEIIGRFSTDSVSLVREGAYACLERSRIALGHKFEQICFVHC